MNNFIRIAMIICFILNIIGIIIAVTFIVLPLFWRESFDFYNSAVVTEIRSVLTIPIFILWIYNFVIWSKRDKNIIRFFFLLLLNFFYNPIYFRMSKKRGWQN